MVAKRRLDFGTPRGKRVKGSPPALVLYRTPKTETKFITTAINHVGSTGTSTVVNNPAQGSGFDQRIGNQIKCWFLEGVVACTASTPIRLDVIIPNDPGAGFLASFDGALDRRQMTVLATKFLTNGTSFAASGAVVRHKFPLGVVTKFSDATAGSINRNTIYCVLTTPSAQTITGYFRVWYKDH